MQPRVSHLDAAPAAVVAAPSLARTLVADARTSLVIHPDAVPALRFERVDCLTA